MADGVETIENEHVAGCNVPAARLLVQEAIDHLSSMAWENEALEEDIDKLSMALGMMTRIFRKRAVMRPVQIEQHHIDHLRRLVERGVDNRKSCAEIAIEIFGRPCHLGWISTEIATLKGY